MSAPKIALGHLDIFTTYLKERLPHCRQDSLRCVAEVLFGIILSESTLHRTEGGEGEKQVQNAVSRAGRICFSVIIHAEGRATISRHSFEKAQSYPAKDREAEVKLVEEHKGVIHDFNAIWADVNEIDVTPGIYLVAGDLSVAYPGLSGMDAVHLASAIEVQKVFESCS